MWWTTLTGKEQLVLVLAGAALLGLIFYYFYFFMRLALYKPLPIAGAATPPLSVVICARNEAENVIALLPKVLTQDYPEFEVVVVDDASWDSTGAELEELEKTHEHLHVVHISEHIQHRPGKKFPLTLGIKKAVHEHLVLTDADCQPASDQWLRHMAARFDGRTEVVLGASPYKSSGGLLSALIRFETLLTGAFYLSFALAGKPYMGVGRNLAYRRSTYNRVGGFKKHYHIVSGDDDLFVQAAATGSNTAVCVHPEALVYSQAPQSWADWWRQKKRHYSTAPHYKLGVKLWLAAYPFWVLLFFVATISLLVYENTRPISLGLIGLKLILQLAIFRGVFGAQNDRWIWLFSPLLEILLLLNQMALWLIGLFSKQSRWK